MCRVDFLFAIHIFSVFESVLLQTRSLGIDSKFILSFPPILFFFCPEGAEFKGGIYYLLIYCKSLGGSRARGRKTQQDPAAKESVQGVWSSGSVISHLHLPHVSGNVLPAYIQVTKYHIIDLSTGGHISMPC